MNQFLATSALQAAMFAVLFLGISHPLLYEITDRLTSPFIGRFVRLAVHGSPTLVGILVHTAVFFFSVWGMLIATRKDNE